MTAIPPPNAEANDREACKRKLRYSTHLFALRIIAKREMHGSPQLTAYLCPECAGWHITKWISK